MSDPLQREIAHQWLRRARSDLALGKAALHTTGVLPADAGFHAQQCAEKALKGLLTFLDVAYPRTHVLGVLLDILKSNSVRIPVHVDRADELTQYAVETRYPGVSEPVSKAEAHKALERAAFVLQWVESQMN